MSGSMRNYLPFGSSSGEDPEGGGGTIFGKGSGEGKGQSLFGDLSESATLTKRQRLYGFIGCFTVGVFLSVMSTFFFFQVDKFAILYTLGNLVGLLSTGFLIGPVKQFKNMFKRKRIIATVVFLVMIVVTILVALVIPVRFCGALSSWQHHGIDWVVLECSSQAKAHG
eukprot:gb/GECG01000266.1/.p1 GENE.gb/GECG01000266.1/~~gb/GECG01000266.1/.p1  ORF type:complete len:168 (+),score=4.67 gb/GECG01000266.1/:1-504(+)